MASSAKRTMVNVPSPAKKPKVCVPGVEFYLVDAYSDSRRPGTIALFGRLDGESCCVLVDKVWPRHYLRVKTGHTAKDAYDEIRRTTSGRFHAKGVTKKVITDGQLPQPEELVEVTTEDNRFATRAEGTTFVRVPTTDTALELLLHESSIQGPGWVKVTEELTDDVTSHCRRNFRLPLSGGQRATIEPIHTTKPAPLFTAMALNVLSVKATRSEDEIVILTMATYDNVVLEAPVQDKPSSVVTFFTAPSTGRISQMEREQMRMLRQQYPGRQTANEEALLRILLARLKREDVDFLLGHNLEHQLEVLATRLRKYSLPSWSQLGRLYQRGPVPSLSNSTSERHRLTAGRAVIDSRSLTTELLRVTSNDLTAILAEVPHTEPLKSISGQEIAAPFYFVNARHTLAEVLQSSTRSLEAAVKVISHLDGLSFYVSLTRRVRGALSRVVTAGNSARVELMVRSGLYHSDYVLPSRCQGNAGSTSYKGGVVLEPIVGFDTGFTLALDFQSLYPSIIQEHNLCITTVVNALSSDTTDVRLPVAGVGEGVIPSLCRSLCESRVNLKKTMTRYAHGSEAYKKLDTQQRALKVLTNSVYGTLGASFSSLYARNLASLIACLGRQLLLDTKQRIEDRGYLVRYGDTDSLYTGAIKATNATDAWKEGRELVDDLNHTRGCLRLELEAVFERLLILGKKRYAALSVARSGDRHTLIRGADVVQRTTPKIVQQLGRDLIDVILQNGPDCAPKPTERLRHFRGLVISGKRPLVDYQIMRMLAKDPSAYGVACPPHADVAKRRNAESSGRYRQGDVVPYVVCINSEGNSTHLQVDEMDRTCAKLDQSHYIEKIVLPMVARLCAHVGGVDKEAVALALGTAPKQTSVSKRPQATRNAFRYECAQCKKTNTADGMSLSKLDGEWLALSHCARCDADLTLQCDELLAQLNATLDRLEKRFSESVFACDDLQCKFETDTVDLSTWAEYGRNTCPTCGSGTMQREYTARQHYNDLVRLKRLFDVKGWLTTGDQSLAKELVTENTKNEDVRPLYDALLVAVEARLSVVPYNCVDLSTLFRNNICQ